MLEISTFTGTDALPLLGDIARLRIEVFRDFPYLYDGSIKYEMDYLSGFYFSEKSLLVVASENARIVGVSTAAPLDEADAAFQAPVSSSGMNPGEIFYFGESVLLPEFRGKGVGHRFFDLREAWAATCGFHKTAFCAVIREPDHPKRPPNYRPLDHFWRSRGYSKRDDLVVKLPWKEFGQTEPETDHDLVYWIRDPA